MPAKAFEKSSYAWGLSDCDSKEQDICVSTRKTGSFLCRWSLGHALRHTAIGIS